MFKQKDENKNKNEGFVDEKGQELVPTPAPSKEEPNPDDVDLKAPFEYTSEHLEEIERGRLDFAKMVKKQNIIKWITATAAIGLLVFTWIFVMGQLKIQWLTFLLTGVSIVIIVAYYVIVKKYNNKKMDAYLKRYYGDMNAFVFGDERFKEVHGDIAGKIDNDEFNDSELYKDVSTIGSRNVVSFKVDGKYDCKICDCAAQKTTMKKLEPLFIGKHLIAKNNYTNDDPIIIYLTGNSRSLPPNNVEQLPKVINTKKMIVYSNNKKYESTLNSKVRNLISNIITNNILVDASIVIKKGQTYFDLGYDDCLMVLPLQTKFNPIPVNRFKKDMIIIADIIAQLNN